MSMTQEERVARHNRLADLRKAIEDEKAVQARVAADQSAELEAATLDAEEARLQAELAQIKRDGELQANSQGGVEDARAAMKAAQERQKAVENPEIVVPAAPVVEVPVADPNKPVDPPEPPADPKNKGGGN